MAKITDKCSVRVAIRIRPQSMNHRLDNLVSCNVVALSQSQIAIGEDRTFTFDYVFDEQVQNGDVFEQCVKQLVDGTFEGYNATVLAYGQTGSGKTFTMGTSMNCLSDENRGIIPRAAEHLFDGINQRKVEARENDELEPMFEVVVQFIELYNEDVIDLLRSGKPLAPIRIVEDLARAEISLKGASNIPVKSTEEMMRILQKGVRNRTTMATNMNQSSSRSHAIFSVFIKQVRDIEDGVDSVDSGVELLFSKLHFVDLAGSERLKKTGATGDRAKEGISINSGLLALGNVISILGAASKNTPAHVPYRNSKLTRLLQDSLGGNSRTLMIACVSSGLTNHIETLNTLQYANRAKNISNKVIVNQAKKKGARESTRLPITSRPNPARLFKQLPACQLKGPNSTKTILRQREQLSKLPGCLLSTSKFSTSARFAPRAYNEQSKQEISELKSKLEKANQAVRTANSINERLKRENSLLKQKVIRLETGLNAPKGSLSAFQTQRQRIPLRTKAIPQKRRSRSVGGKPGPGGFYLPICLMPAQRNHEISRL